MQLFSNLKQKLEEGVASVATRGLPAARRCARASFRRPLLNMAARWAASRVSADAVASLRDRYCEETGGQVLHYSFYIREGWVACYALHRAGEAPEHPVGYCAVVEAGPWEGKPAVFQFWVAPSDRMATFALFEVACEAAGAVGVATQLNAPLLPALMHAYCVQVTTESIVFEDQHPALRLEAPEGGSQLRSLTSSDDTASAMAKGRGGCEFSLHAGDGPTVATGGISFHYNPVRPGGPPYGDIYYEVAADRRGQVIKKPRLCVVTLVCVFMCNAELTVFIPVCCVRLFTSFLYNHVQSGTCQRWSGYFATKLKQACCTLPLGNTHCIVLMCA